MDKLERVHAEVAQHLGDISDLFNQRPKITIVIRTPWLQDGGILISDDDFDEAIAEIQRLRLKQGVALKIYGVEQQLSGKEPGA